MILQKKLKPKEVLHLIGKLFREELDNKFKDKSLELDLSFCEDHSIEIYLVDTSNIDKKNLS